MSRTVLLIGTVAGLALAACRENTAGPDMGSLKPSLSVDQLKTSPVVNSDADDGDGTCTDTKCTLRDAIAYADAGATITFDLPPFARIHLQSGELTINKNLTIAALGAVRPEVTAVHEAPSRIVRVTGGAIATISGLTIFGGSNNSRGGGVLVESGTLTIDKSAIIFNESGGGDGGGIAVDPGSSLTVTRSEVSRNFAKRDAGGILNGGTLTVINSTIYLNRSGQDCGAGIVNRGGSVTVSHSTITQNSSACSGTGILSSNGTVTVSNSIVAGNAPGNCSGTSIVDGGYNLDSGTSCGFSASNHSLSSSNPQLGLRVLVPAVYVIAGTSPAFNAIPQGTNGCGTTYVTDQRGVARPQHGSCDIGPYELQDNTDPSVTVITPANGGTYAVGSSVTADYSCEDLESGIASCVGMVENGSSIDTEFRGKMTFKVTATDRAGHSTTTGVSYQVIETTAPTISVVTPAEGAAYLLHQTVLANYSCQDEAGGSGLADCTAAVANGSPINTSSVGSGHFTVFASDRDGNVAFVNVHYTVSANFQGFAAPVDNNGTLNVAKAGKTIPLKWRLVDANGAPVTTLAAVTATVANLPCDLVATADAVEEFSAGASGLQNLGDGYYQYNWKSLPSYANSCKTLQLDLGEGSPRTASFQFTK